MSDSQPKGQVAPSKHVERWTAALAMIAVTGLLVLALVTTADVMLRYLFARPLTGFVELAALGGAVLLAACMPYLLASRSNMAVDALGRHLGPVFRRWLDGFGSLMTAGFSAVMAWQYVLFALDLRDTGQSIPVLRWPVWPWWAAVAAFIVLAAFAGFATSWPAREERE